MLMDSWNVCMYVRTYVPLSLGVDL